MFGIGGGELIFILFIALMLFGSENIPTIARNIGKVMAQVKNATNDIKSEITKSAEESGIDKSIKDLTSGFTKQIDEVKSSINSQIENPIEDIKQEIEDISGPIKRQL
jgi:sec-independent protein translocase protein TatA